MFPLTVKYESPVLNKAEKLLKKLQEPGKLKAIFETNFMDSITEIPETQTLTDAYPAESDDEHIDHLRLESEDLSFKIVLRPSIQMIQKSTMDEIKVDKPCTFTGKQCICLRDTIDPDAPDLYLEKGMDFIKALETVKPLTAFPMTIPIVDGKLIDIQFNRAEYKDPDICPTVIFTLGDHDLKEFWGDDWNDRECSDPVYDRYVKENLILSIPIATEIIDQTDIYDTHLCRNDCIEQAGALINIYQDEQNFYIPMCLDAKNLLQILYLCHFFDPERYFWRD